MRRVNIYRAVAFVVAMCLLVLGALSTQTSALGSARWPAWCYESESWLPYAEGIPGSATQEEFTACLRRSAEQGYVVAFDVQLVEGGALIDVGDRSLFWTLPRLFALELSVIAYQDNVIIRDSCDRAFQVRDRAVRMIDPGFPCVRHQRIQLDGRTLNEVDFTIFVVNQQFIIDATEGWYHVVRDETGWNDNPTPRSRLPLKGVHGSVWAATDYEIYRGVHHEMHRPVANTGGDSQQYFAYDWERRVEAELFPPSFDHTAYYLLPDWDAYWTEVRSWLDAIIYDLYRGRADPVQLEVLDELGWVAYSVPSTRTIATSYGSATMILHELGHILAGDGEGHGERFIATVLMLWERYIPGFDTQRALDLADRYMVSVGTSPDVESVSERTTAVRELFAKEAPLLPSDNTSISPDDMLLQVILEVGKTYRSEDEKVVATSGTMPTCTVEESYLDGSTYEQYHGLWTEFTVNAGGNWNGLELVGFSSYSAGGQILGSGTVVEGTPTLKGRVRVKVMTRCPGGKSQEPRFVGYSEIIVVDPDEE